MTNKTLFLFAIALVATFTFSTFTFAATNVDDQITDTLNQKTQDELLQQATTLNEKITFTPVNSCQSMETVFSDFLETYKKYYPERPYYYGYDVLFEAPMTNSVSFEAVERAKVNDVAGIADAPTAGGGSEYSTTNLQKANVDEPEILKSNGEYLFYYANTNYGNDSYISILKAPKKADLSDAEVLKKITIPATLSNIQLFLQNNYLIILGTRYSQTESVLGNARSIAIVYDITDMEHLLLKKLIEVQGSYQDARIVDGELYLISNISLNRYDIAYAEKPFVFNDILPTSIELVLKANPTSALTGNILNSYNKIKTSLPCNSIFYLFPSEETLKEHYLLPNFTLISKLSLENVEKKLEQKLVFGAVDEFHMSEEALYLPSPIYFSSPRKCLGCWRPTYNAGQNTLIHKFTLGKTVDYQTSLIVPGTPLNQYAMDEDEKGNFRILTKTRSPNLATQFFVFDKNFKLAGQLLNIEPGEEFKSSRYIGDKLYLVTFQQIDPLFVVDVADITQPKIVGELKIPGYSTYLHPYEAAKNNIQYLIGLGYSVKDNRRGGVTNDSMKVDLYKIDYNKKETLQTKCSSFAVKGVDTSNTNLCVKSDTPCSDIQKLYEECAHSVNSGNIAVELVHSYDFTGGTATSPALNNPRMFVRDVNKKLLLLPVFIYAHDSETYNPTTNFVGLKGLTIQPNAEIKESISQHFTSLSGTQSRAFTTARVGYLGDVNYFLWNDFAAFTKGEKIFISHLLLIG